MLQQADIIKEPERLLNYATIIDKENNRLRNQVERVLQLASLENDALQLNKSSVSMHRIINEATQQFSAHPDIRFKLRLDATNDKVLGDTLHLSNVIYNLLDNAIKYSPEKTEISVSTTNSENKIAVQISDQGVGMSSEEIKHVFDKFYRVATGNRHDVKGFGIGLSYVKLIIEEHSGEIKVKSAPGKGSVFTITLINEA